MSAELQSSNLTSGRLAHFPVAFFASVMGLSGLSLAWMKASHVLAITSVLPTALAAVTASVFFVLTLAYGAKLALYPNAAIEEYRHPIKLHFLPTFSISLILLSLIALE